MICDFCTAPDPVWRYYAETYVVERLQVRSLSEWLACDECAKLIETNQWNRLAKRSLQYCPHAKLLIAIAGHEQALAEVVSLHREFNAHRTPRQRWPLEEKA